MKEKIIKLRKDGKTYNEIQEILKCSKSTISYYCKKINGGDIDNSLDLTVEDVEKIKEYYKIHSLKETKEYFNISVSSIFKYCGRKTTLLSPEEKKRNSVNAVKKRRRKVKEMAVEYKGGSCEICGYDKYYGALEFHHKDPNEKDFSISSKGYTKSWEMVKKELDKCIMVCSNCHKELHDKIRNN